MGVEQVTRESLMHELNIVGPKITQAMFAWRKIHPLSQDQQKYNMAPSHGYCHVLNFALTLWLHEKFKLPIVSYHDRYVKSSKQPTIAYVFDGGVHMEARGGISGVRKHDSIPLLPEQIINHSFPIIVGLGKPIIVDCANDQVRQNRPFLLKEATGSTPEDIKRLLIAYGHRILRYDSSPLGKEAMNVVLQVERVAIKNRKLIEEHIEDLVQTKQITSDELLLIKSQRLLEKSAGLESQLLLIERDALEFIASSIGIHYPSIDRIVTPLAEQLFGNSKPATGVKIIARE